MDYIEKEIKTNDSLDYIKEKVKPIDNNLDTTIELKKELKHKKLYKNRMEKTLNTFNDINNLKKRMKDEILKIINNIQENRGEKNIDKYLDINELKKNR